MRYTKHAQHTVSDPQDPIYSCLVQNHKPAIYSASMPPSRPAFRDSVWMNRLMRKRHGRRVPRATAR